ncbi:glycosyltransferase family 2 protein [Aureispira anguillae]|uniref:Glycosyltransferase family 2 protein n=1 Tax=Aureispira anguillae TaxID=2864201 RepID=A0A915YIA6_9BACT|nr:glycosyltransferase family 2 protein [Aureispira anguillae]BDS13398.1 glycosyltransferase family 2 protein [Aureispira anguillae]
MSLKKHKKYLVLNTEWIVSKRFLSTYFVFGGNLETIVHLTKCVLKLSETANQSWSIIILCYNEEGNIKRVVQKVQDTLQIISTPKGEIILVNDGSSDGSDAVIQEMLKDEKNKNIRYICHTINRGIGEALHSGYASAKGDNVVMVPGDGQFDMDELIPYKNIPERSILAFYRVENMTYSLARNILSWFNNKLNRIFIGLSMKDVNWVKVYKNQALKALDLEIRSSLVESEICSKLIYLGHQPIEIESKYLPRKTGLSKGASWKIIKQAIIDTPILILVFRRFKNKNKRL